MYHTKQKDNLEHQQVGIFEKVNMKTVNVKILKTSKKQ